MKVTFEQRVDQIKKRLETLRNMTPQEREQLRIQQAAKPKESPKIYISAPPTNSSDG